MVRTARSAERAPCLCIKVGAWKVEAALNEIHALLPHIRICFTNTRASEQPLENKDSSPLQDAVRLIVHLIKANAQVDVVTTAFRAFEADFLRDIDLHSLLPKIEQSDRQYVLRAFSLSFKKPKQHSKSALLEAAKHGHARLQLVFGGQGTANNACLQDLLSLYTSFGPIVEDLFTLADITLRDLSSKLQSQTRREITAFDLFTWLQEPGAAPARADLASAPISFPLIGLLSLAHYAIACRMLNKTPGDISGLLVEATGHSQGIITAAVIAQSDSWEDFHWHTKTALKTLFWIGYESQIAAPSSALSAEKINDAIDNGEGRPSPMLSVRGLPKKDLRRCIEEVNSSHKPEQALYLALVNTPTSMVVAGPPKCLLGLCYVLRKLRAPEGMDQSRIPFIKRRPTVQCLFLPISAPFHTPYLQNASQKVLRALEGETMSTSNLRVSLRNTSTGTDCRQSSEDLLTSLVRMVMTEPVDWPSACLDSSSTHILDFGPGRPSTYLSDLVVGSGKRSILVSESISTSPDYFSRAALFDSVLPESPSSWKQLYMPKLQRRSDGSVRLETKMSRLFGVPPIMVGGMTPTTVPWDFVAAVMNAGYHIEVAAGGYVEPQALESAIYRIAKNVPSDRGVTCNLIYVNPKAMAWQIPLIRKMIAAGARIDGITIGAGIPSPEVVSEYIQTLGLRHISFKPGSTSAIEEVISIAKAHPQFPVGLQWTGGRGGGHHSYEDFHEPILRTYAKIRSCPNIVLVAGSGFGNASGIAPYISGKWSTEFGYPDMPFDGVLLGSRMMVAKEAHTSPQVKALIAQTPGCDDSEWHNSYDRTVGGVITVNSEMGQPIHKIANRAVMLWKDLDNLVFSIKDPEKRLQKLQSMRSNIIARLNADYAKPWFAVDNSGANMELDDMTYYECLHRLVSLMYLASEKRWIDSSYRQFVVDFLERARARLGEEIPFVDKVDNDFESGKLLERFLVSCPNANSEVLYPEDASFFLGLCKRRGQKPINFIPRLDRDFETYFKKDSLWQAEDTNAVVDKDAQRVCIIHGPVAAYHSVVVDEPVGTILDGILNALVEELSANLETAAHTDTEPCSKVIRTTVLNVALQQTSNERKYTLACRGELQERDELVQYMLQSHTGWAAACLLDKHVRQGDCYRKNPIRAAFRPIHGDSIVLRTDESGEVSRIDIHTMDPRSKQPQLVLTLSYTNRKDVTFTMYAHSGSQQPRPSLNFTYNYVPHGQCYRLEENSTDRETKIKSFYASLWQIHGLAGAKAETSGARPNEHVVTVAPDLVADFMSIIAGADTTGVAQEYATTIIPMDFAIVLAWKDLTRHLISPDVSGDLFRLLHRSNSFEYYPEASPLLMGDILAISSSITANSVLPSGRLLEVEAIISKDQKPVVKVISSFFIQGEFEDHHRSLRRTEEPTMLVTVDSPLKAELLRSRKWLIFREPNVDLRGTTLAFKAVSEQRNYRPDNLRDIVVVGTVLQERDSEQIIVADIQYTHSQCNNNAVLDFLNRHGYTERTAIALEHPGWTDDSPLQLQIPSTMGSYSRVSGDTNPIHTSPVFAGYANLPCVVTHGMLTSALVRGLVERVVAEADCARFRKWSCSFEGMVFPGDALDVELQHTHMIDGRMLFKVQAYRTSDREQVIEAEAEIEQEATAYLFCGQGSQEKGMGMDFYQTSAAAKAIWDRGDQHLRELYGFSLIDIVRNDPQSITVHFGGRRGRVLRNNYLQMTRKIIKDGEEVSVPMLPGLTTRSTSYTFREERGLLFSTQFAQPALCLMEIADMEALKSQGLVQEGSMFAGHSLGEYSALAACTSFMSLENLLSLVFYRGLTMQIAMTRDEDGRTDFAMVAVNPSRISKGFTENSFNSVVQHIVQQSGLLLETVNWNIEGQQYVCAGHLRALLTLGKVCDTLAGLSRPEALSNVQLDDIVQDACHSSLLPGKDIVLPRGVATTPLVGIDVPFHSTYLQGGIDIYRKYLQTKVREQDIEVDQLVGKWIPNVVGRPFSVDRTYVEEVVRVTGSAPLQRLLGVEVH